MLSSVALAGVWAMPASRARLLLGYNASFRPFSKSKKRQSQIQTLLRRFPASSGQDRRDKISAIFFKSSTPIVNTVIRGFTDYSSFLSLLPRASAASVRTSSALLRPTVVSAAEARLLVTRTPGKGGVRSILLALALSFRFISFGHSTAFYKL
jgi:hypothetical protein